MRIPIVVALAFLFAQTSAPKGIIEGRVLRSGSREPISDVLVTLVGPPPANPTSNLSADAAARLSTQIAALTDDGNRGGIPQATIDNAIENARRNAGVAVGRQMTALTDASGNFSFRDLTPGRYTIRAERDGYFANPLNGTASTVVTKAVTLQDGRPNEPQDLLMAKGAVISGRVRDPNGQLISAMTVSVYRVTYTNGRKIWSISNSKPTDDRGEYRIYWLYPGEYYVGVTPRAPGPTPGPQDLWARTFFPGVTEPSAATPIVVHDGSEFPATDVTIRNASLTAFKISGVVINPVVRPNPTTGAVDRSISSFVLSPREPGVLDSINPPSVVNALPAASRQNGEFEIRNIRTGAYDLYPLAPVITDTTNPSAGVPAPAQGAAAPVAVTNTIQIIGGTVITGVAGGVTIGGPNTTRRQPTSRTPIEVTRDITDLRIVVSLGAPLTGEVQVKGTPGQTLKPESIRLTLRNLDTMPASFASLIGTIPVDSAGKFSVPNVPEARYTFQVSGLPSAAYVADIRQGGSSVMDNGFVLDSGAAPVQVIVDPNGVTVEGTVQNAEGKPAASVTVVLVPPLSRRQNALLYRTAMTNDTGAFTLRGVPPGPYSIFAWESVLPTAWQNAEFIAQYESRGRPINVTTASTTNLQLNMIPIEDRH